MYEISTENDNLEVVVSSVSEYPISDKSKIASRTSGIADGKKDGWRVYERSK